MFETMRLRAAMGTAALAALFVFSLAGCDLLTRKGTIEGVVFDTTTGSGLSNVVASVVGHSSYSDTTGADGAFSFEVPAGSVTLRFVLSGYVFSDVTVAVTAGETTTVPYGAAGGNPPLASGSYRFVLTWGATPGDLDSHLITPNGLEVYFNNTEPTGAGANLDVDDTSSYGPETITITEVQAGTYQYYVHNYSGSPDITTSGAQVRFYSSTGLVQTFAVPTTGTGDYWLVCTLNGTTGAVDLQAQITGTDPAASLPRIVPAASLIGK